jgi:hypothetical protein
MPPHRDFVPQRLRNPQAGFAVAAAVVGVRKALEELAGNPQWLNDEKTPLLRTSRNDKVYFRSQTPNRV